MKKLIVAGAALALCVMGAQADLISVSGNMGVSDWNDATFWGGTEPTAGNDYVVYGSGSRIRSSVTSQDAFGGDSLGIQTGAELFLKTDGGPGRLNVNLILQGGRVTIVDNIVANNRYRFNNGYTMTVQTNSYLYTYAVDRRALEFANEWLGDAVLSTTFAASQTVRFVTGADLDSFGGTLAMGTDAHLQFEAGITLGGGLDLQAGSLTYLQGQSLNVSQLAIGGSLLGDGTYDYTYLNANYDAYFVDGDSGSITVSAVPEPTTWALLGIGAGMIVARRRMRRRA